jgi:hypothetical protein
MSEFSKSRIVFVNAVATSVVIVAIIFAAWFYYDNVWISVALITASLVIVMIFAATGMFGKLAKEFTIEPYNENLDFTDWDDESLESYTELVKYRLTQNYRRENSVLRRSGSMLALNGVVLALVGTAMINLSLTHETQVFLVCSVVLLFVSALFAVWSMYSYRFKVISVHEIYREFHPKDQTLRDLNINILKGLIQTQRNMSAVSRIRSSTYAFGSCLAVTALFFIAFTFGTSIL